MYDFFADRNLGIIVTLLTSTSMEEAKSKFLINANKTNFIYRDSQQLLTIIRILNFTYQF
jgi:hypothetical protein